MIRTVDGTPDSADEAPLRYDSSLDAIDTAILSAASVAWTALPDYVSDPTLRRGLRTGLLLGGASIIGMRAHLMGGDGTSDPSAGEQHPSGDDAQQRIASLLGDSPPAGWVAPVLAGVAVVTLAGGVVASQKIDDAVAGHLKRRGVRHPYTVTGLTWGVLAALTARLDPADRA